MTANAVVKQFHSTMTAKEMHKKFGHHLSAYGKEARKLGVSLVPELSRGPRVLKTSRTALEKSCKSTNDRNPEIFKMKKMDYSLYDLIPVGEYNEEIYVLKTATPEEVREAIERRRAQIQEHKDRNRITPIK